jgi:multisubunit Na+/H+ antiporter MnhB subunit
VIIQGIDTPYLIVGYSLGALSLLVSILGTAWTWQNRNSRVVRKLQPIFLLMIGFGSSIMAAALIPAGFQPPFSQHILDNASWTCH